MKRYDIKIHSSGACTERLERSDGEYIRYEDYKNEGKKLVKVIHHQVQAVLHGHLWITLKPAWDEYVYE